ARLVSSGLPRLQPCEISAFKIGDDFIGDSTVNVQFLAHGVPLLFVGLWVHLLMNRCPSARTGCASRKENPREWRGRSRRRATVALIVLVGAPRGWPLSPWPRLRPHNAA